MTAPTVSRDQLQRVHEALRIAVPLDQASPMVLSTLAVIAHCWRGRIPDNLWSDAELQHLPPAARRNRTAPVRRATHASGDKTHQATIDFKRRASGDID